MDKVEVIMMDKVQEHLDQALAESSKYGETEWLDLLAHVAVWRQKGLKGRDLIEYLEDYGKRAHWGGAK